MRTITVLLLLICLQGCEKIRNEPVTILRDCSGTYLRFDGKDYEVCNVEKTNKFEAGTSVKVTFKRVDKCVDGSKSAAICFLLHVNEGLVEVQKIK